MGTSKTKVPISIYSGVYTLQSSGFILTLAWVIQVDGVAKPVKKGESLEIHLMRQNLTVDSRSGALTTAVV